MIASSDTPLRADDAHLLAQVTRAYRTLSAGNRTLLRATDEQDLLTKMCRVVVESGGYTLACVGYAEHDLTQRIHWMAYAGFDPNLRHMTWADIPAGQTASGTAIRTGEPVIGRNLRTSIGYAAWREKGIEQLLAQGCEAASAFPLRIDDEIIGCLTIAAAEPDAFDSEEVRLLGELANDLGYGIANLRVRAHERDAQARIARIAFTDTLTGLPNRARMRERLAAALESASSERRPLALLHIELTRYPEICETLGYQGADQLLKVTARSLAHFEPAPETFARVGEADFALVLDGTDAVHAVHIAAQVLAVLNRPIELAGLQIAPQGSIGIALCPGHGTDPDILSRRAKVAAYDAKRSMTGYRTYIGSVDQERTLQLALMADLRRAIEHNELLLYCQPKVTIANKSICGSEALVRWIHPQCGLQVTGDFIKLAEQTGLITSLTRWVLDAACRQSYDWHEAGSDWPISVNLSARDLREPELLPWVRGAISTWGLTPERLQFELTESALMADPAGSLDTLARLKDLGVKLFIDDFGTGYSSLAYLQRLPVDSIKIDQSFISSILSDNDSATIVRSTIELGHNLDLDIVAEGVESRETWDYLATLGCDAVQGNFVSFPMPSEQFLGWESRWRAEHRAPAPSH